jgi:pyridoxamine---pyruvate transaminase
MREPSYTLTAGPTGGWPSVEAAMGAPLVYDYDPLFLERFARTERKVAELFRTAGDVVLMQGEAVLGLEAAARALVRPGMTALNLVSGVYAKWFGIWLAECGANLVEVEVPYDEAIPVEAVARALEDHPETALVAVVHSETPSGVLNPLREIA